MSRAGLGALVVVAWLIVPGVAAGAGLSASTFSSAVQAPRGDSPVALPGLGSFAFVANFEDRGLDGWTVASGTASVVSSPNYNGEPTLRSVATRSAPQVDLAGAASGVVAGDPFVSFQAEVHPGTGVGFVGLASASGAPLAVIGAGDGSVWAGTGPSVAVAVEPIPLGTAQPWGWVYLAANVYEVPAQAPTPPAWVMDVFADRTDQLAASQVPVPAAGSYAAFFLNTTRGTVDYTNTVLTDYQIPTQIPGYNNMDGYGQGSGLLVQLLPAFTTLTATMRLTDWNTPEAGILSFQINAMNYYGTTRSTCKGFFQLGVDLNPEGRIAPWYVPGSNCVAHYFGKSNTPAISDGFFSPPGTVLHLEIQDRPAEKQVFFQIIDTSSEIAAADRYWNASVAYGGSAFYGTYTQVEWQPCCSNSPIAAYFLNGTLRDMEISGGEVGVPLPLAADYMLPFALDLPPSWNLNFYDSTIAGYHQVG